MDTDGQRVYNVKKRLELWISSFSIYDKTVIFYNMLCEVLMFKRVTHCRTKLLLPLTSHRASPAVPLVRIFFKKMIFNLMLSIPNDRSYFLWACDIGTTCDTCRVGLSKLCLMWTKHLLTVFFIILGSLLNILYLGAGDTWFLVYGYISFCCQASERRGE